jgi:hypothetical protein
MGPPPRFIPARNRAGRAVLEANMPLLMWYLPFIIFSSACERAMHPVEASKTPEDAD